MIPDSVTNIGEYAFDCCSHLTSVTISDGLTSIGEFAFFACRQLTSVIIPESVTTIEEYAFGDCDNLTSITIKNPDCEICDSSETIANGENNDVEYYNGTIYGYAGSTAQAYAEKYGYQFDLIDNFSEPTKPDPVQGDADGDGTLAVTDVISIQRAILSGEKFPNWESCDFYPDGVINVFDLILMKKALLAK